MARRTIATTLANYIDPAGVSRQGWQGETVSVHADHVHAFDVAQAAATGAEPPAEPKRRRRTADGDPVQTGPEGDGESSGDGDADQ